MDNEQQSVTTHQLLASISDNPGQVREPAMSALMRQCYRAARFGENDEMDYSRVKF